jgi:hypothetical protein
LVSLQEQSKDNNLVETSGASKSSGKVTAIGSTYHLVLSGLTLGVSEVTTVEPVTVSSGGSERFQEQTTIRARYNEMGLTLGQIYSVSFGVGALVDGEVKSQMDYSSALTAAYGISDETIQADQPNGNSAFVVLGYDCEPIELLLGYRWNNLRAKLSDSGTGLETLSAANELSYEEDTFSRQTSQVQFGLGLSF